MDEFKANIVKAFGTWRKLLYPHNTCYGNNRVSTGKKEFDFQSFPFFEAFVAINSYSSRADIRNSKTGTVTLGKRLLSILDFFDIVIVLAFSK